MTASNRYTGIADDSVHPDVEIGEIATIQSEDIREIPISGGIERTERYVHRHDNKIAAAIGLCLVIGLLVCRYENPHFFMYFWRHLIHCR